MKKMARALDQGELRLTVVRIQPVFYLRKRHNIIGFTLNQQPVKLRQMQRRGRKIINGRRNSDQPAWRQALRTIQRNESTE